MGVGQIWLATALNWIVECDCTVVEGHSLGICEIEARY
jgi:hypothetical protein